MDNVERKVTLEDIKRDYPNVVPPEILSRYFGKRVQNIRNMAEKGQFPFALVEKRKTRNTYIFPTERFIAWIEGRM